MFHSKNFQEFRKILIYFWLSVKNFQLILSKLSGEHFERKLFCQFWKIFYFIETQRKISGYWAKSSGQGCHNCILRAQRNILELNILINDHVHVELANHRKKIIYWVDDWWISFRNILRQKLKIGFPLFGYNFTLGCFFRAVFKLWWRMNLGCVSQYLDPLEFPLELRRISCGISEI